MYVHFEINEMFSSVIFQNKLIFKSKLRLNIFKSLLETDSATIWIVFMVREEVMQYKFLTNHVMFAVLNFADYIINHACFLHNLDSLQQKCL